MRMRHIVICACQSHDIFLHYLMNGTILELNVFLTVHHELTIH